MLEGLALWALLVYIAVKVFRMPWNKYTQSGSVIGGACWLVFVWVGMIAWSPMDMTGGSVVQSPQIHLRPESSDVKGTIESLHIKPNQKIEKGQIIYEIDDTQLQNDLTKINNDISVNDEQLNTLIKNHEISIGNLELSKIEIKTSESDLKSKKHHLNYLSRV